MTRVYLLPCIVLACGLATDIRAGPLTLPGGAEGERMGERLHRDATPSRAPDAPQAREDVAIPPGAEQVRFVVRETLFRGQSVYSLTDLEQELAAGSDGAVSLADLYRFAGRLTRRYWDEGYILARVRLASYDPRRGSVTFEVSEGHVERVVLDDDHHPPTRQVEAVVARLRALPLFHLPTVERYLLALNDLPGLTAGVVLEAGQHPGSVTVIVQVRQKDAAPEPWTASLDNLGSRYLGPFQLSLAHRFRDVLTDSGRLDIAAFGSLPMDEVRFGSASYAEPITPSGTTLELSASYGNTAPGYLLSSREVDGSSSTFGIKLTEPIVRTRREQVNLSTELAFKQVHTSVLGATVADDRIRVAEAELTYDGPDAAGGLFSGAVRIAKGLDLFGATETGSDNLSRADGHSNFVKVSGNLSRTQAVGDDLAAVIGASGQYSATPLLSSEEFGFGGQAAGRGYDPSEFTGNRGISATFELRYTGLPDYSPWVLQPFAFYDVGKVWDIGQGSKSGASTGLGLRFQFEEQVNGSVYLAEPLTAPVSTPPYGNGKSPRFLFSIARSF